MILQPVSSIFPCSPLPFGLGELQACPFPDVVFPPLPLSHLFLCLPLSAELEPAQGLPRLCKCPTQGEPDKVFMLPVIALTWPVWLSGLWKPVIFPSFLGQDRNVSLCSVFSLGCQVVDLLSPPPPPNILIVMNLLYLFPENHENQYSILEIWIVCEEKKKKKKNTNQLTTTKQWLLGFWLRADKAVSTNNNQTMAFLILAKGWQSC